MTRRVIGPLVALSCIAGIVAAVGITAPEPLGAQRINSTADNLQVAIAFPTAIGWGARASGGRDGRMVFVTSLADRGKGTLRDCLEQSGARTCVFRVNGTIRFATPVVIRNPHLTIAGQTAPGGGITVAHAGGTPGRTPLIIKNTQNVVVRHIRVRPDRNGGERGSEDAITIENSKWVILDQVSASWARDELVNGYGDNNNITISRSIFAWGVPPHDNCALLASDPKGAQRVSFIGNICAHNGDRNPDVNFPSGSCVEVVGNVFYNAQSRFTEIWEQYGGTPISLVGNTYIAGPDTYNLTQGIARDPYRSTGRAQIYLQDNVFEGAFQNTANLADAIVDNPPCALTVNPAPAAAAQYAALAGAGAWPRDPLDERVAYDIQNRTGRIGADDRTIPRVATGAPYADRDSDGMDDSWEAAHGADPRRADPWTDTNRNGWSNFDDFLAYREALVMQ